MVRKAIERYIGKFVRIYQQNERTFWTGRIQTVGESATTMLDKFERLVTLGNGDIKTISEWR